MNSQMKWYKGHSLEWPFMTELQSLWNWGAVFPTTTHRVIESYSGILIELNLCPHSFLLRGWRIRLTVPTFESLSLFLVTSPILKLSRGPSLSHLISGSSRGALYK